MHAWTDSRIIACVCEMLQPFCRYQAVDQSRGYCQTEVLPGIHAQ